MNLQLGVIAACKSAGALGLLKDFNNVKRPCVLGERSNGIKVAGDATGLSYVLVNTHTRASGHKESEKKRSMK